MHSSEKLYYQILNDYNKGLDKIYSKMDSYLSASEFYLDICNLILKFPQIKRNALYLPIDFSKSSSNKNICISHAGDINPISEGEKNENIKSFKISLDNDNDGALIVEFLNHNNLEIIDYELKKISTTISLYHKNQHINRQLKLSFSRLNVFNQLNQLVSTNISLKRLPTTLAREASFRFGADCGLILLMGKSESDLNIKGIYGCVPKTVPESVPLTNSILSRSLQVDGVFSISDIAKLKDESISFLTKSDISCIHYHALIVKKEFLGLLLIGYRQNTLLNENDTIMLEEFSHGAAVAISRTISQHQLSEYAEGLEDIVKERTEDLAIQTAKSEEANLAKSRFVANMSHELRTPLTAIIGYSSVMADGLYGEINPKQKEALISISKSSELLKALIDDVLNLSRIEAGKEEPEPIEIELLPLLKQIYKLIIQSAISKGIKVNPIKVSNEIENTKLFIDSRHIRQILINLMSNAVKYTHTGGEISVTCEIIADKIKINVNDTGVGISESKLKKLFERFERGEDSYSLSQQGTGLGLSLSKHLAEINGGTVGVKSVLGEGSTFWVLAPLANASVIEEEKISEEKELLNTRIDGLNLLVVDDNELTCNILNTIIKKAGGNAYIAHSVKEAKSLAKSVDLDGALIDLAMPKENGINLIKYFKKSPPPFSTMPLIVVSACVFEKDKEEAFFHGASDFIPKPFKPHELLSTIRRLTISSVINSTGSFKAIR